MPRFVVLEHYWNGVHWDFMLEVGAALRTWALQVEPTPHAHIDARALPAHRLAYLDYEGPISGDRGSVRRWDRGSFDWVLDSPDEVIVELHGERLAGRAHLSCAASGDWSFVWSGVGESTSSAT